jgi:hypothetical protein
LQHALNGNINKNKKSTKLTVVGIPVPKMVVKSKGNKNKNSSKSSGSLGLIEAVSRAYAASLLSPFDVQPPSLGFGKWSTNMGQFQAYLRGSFTTTAGDFATIFNPNAFLSPTNGARTTSILSSYFSIVNQALPSTLWNVGSTGQTCANLSTFSTQIQSHRPISAGVRILVGSPLTSNPGVIGAARLEGVNAITNLDAFSNNLFFSVPSCKEYMQKDGLAAVTQCYFPSDYSDFEMANTNNTTNSNNLGLFQPLVILGTGLATGTRVTYECVVNFEAYYGSQTSTSISESNAPSEVMASYIASPDQLMAHASKHVDTHARFSTDESYSVLNPEQRSSFTDLLGHASDWMNGISKVVKGAKNVYSQLRPIASVIARRAAPLLLL